MAILVVALGLRLHGIGFGLPGIDDPDELMFELGAVHMLKTASLDPGWYGHPAMTTMALLALIDVGTFLWGHAAGTFHTVKDFVGALYLDPGLVMVPGRTAMALFGVANVGLVARLGRRLSGEVAGLGAAALLALDPVHVSWSQVIRSDVMACAFLLMACDRAIDLARAPTASSGNWKALVWAAVAWALAVASKWPFALAAMPVMAGLALRARAVPAARGRLVPMALAFPVLGVLFLLVIAPYLAVEHARVLHDVTGEAQQHHLGSNGGTPWQNLGWYVSGPMVGGLGLAGLLLLVAGMVPAARCREARALVLPPFVAFAALLCFQHLVWERWALPLLVLASLVAGFGWQALVAVVARRGLGLRRGLAWALTAGLLALALAPLALADLAQARARGNDTRQRASAWAIAHVPAGSTVLVEHFAFDLLGRPWRLMFPLGDRGCLEAHDLLGGRISHASISAGRGSRSNVDFGTVRPDKRTSCRADYAILSQADRYFAESDLFTGEVQAYRDLLSQGQEVARFTPAQGISAGPAIRIVHFPIQNRPFFASISQLPKGN